MMTSHCEDFGGWNIGRLLSKPPIRQNKFPAKISGHTVVGTEEPFTISVQVYFYPCLEEERNIMVELLAELCILNLPVN